MTFRAYRRRQPGPPRPGLRGHPATSRVSTRHEGPLRPRSSGRSARAAVAACSGSVGTGSIAKSPGGPEAISLRLVLQADPPLQVEVDQARTEFQLFQLSQDLRPLPIQVGGIERIADAPCLGFTCLRQEWLNDGESLPEEISTGFNLGELEEPFERLGRGAVAKFQRGVKTNRAAGAGLVANNNCRRSSSKERKGGDSPHRADLLPRCVRQPAASSRARSTGGSSALRAPRLSGAAGGGSPVPSRTGIVGVVRGSSIAGGQVAGRAAHGAVGADARHPPKPTSKTPIPHHRRMANPADTMSGIVGIGWKTGVV